MQGKSFEQNLKELEIVYRWYDGISRNLTEWACHPGCSMCCTSLVSLTTLEAAYLWGHCPDVQKREFLAGSDEDMLTPLALTTNEYARLCLDRKDIQEETPPSGTLPCPLLEADRCTCYETRPLMCRLMLSTISCDNGGRAEMPSMLLSLTTVCQQIIEHMDRNGWSGYLRHLLPRFSDPAFLKDCRTDNADIEYAGLRHNRPNPGFIVPPEHQEHVRQWLKALDEKLQAP